MMLNEHHDTPFCMGAAMDVEASLLAKTAKRVKIILLGNPARVVSHPPRLAEELAMIDMISGGRLVLGFIRGAGSEQIFNNANRWKRGTLGTDAEVQACNCAIFVYSSEAPRICDAGIASRERHATARATSDLTRALL